MSRTLSQAAQTISADQLLRPLTDGAAALLEQVRQHRRQAQSRRILSALSDQQLEDVGVDRSAIVAARPVIEVEAGLMANLMSLR